MTSVPPPFQHPGPPPPLPEVPEGAEVAGPPEARDGLPRLNVPVWAPFAALLATFIGVLVLTAVAALVVAIGGGELDVESNATTVVLTAGQAAILVASAWYAVQVLSGRPTPASFGLRIPRLLPALGWTLLAFVTLIFVAGLVEVLFGGAEDQQLRQDIKEEDAFAVLAGLAVLSCVIAPLAEEFFFRGFMFRVLGERMPMLWAALVTGGVFGVIHAAGSPAEALITLSAFGTILCLLFWRTGSLIPCIMLHSFNNSIAFAATKELPWWGFLLLVVGSVGTTLLVPLLAARLGRRAAPAAA